MNTSSIEVFNVIDSLPSSNIKNSDAVICPGESKDINISFTGTAPWSFTYTINGSNPTTIDTDANPYLLNVNESGTYEIVELSDAKYSGTCFTGNAVITYYDPPPSVEISTDDPSICKEEQIDLRFDLTGMPPWSFSYTLNMVNQSEITTSENPYFISVSEPGQYNVTQITDRYCQGTELLGNVNIEIIEDAVSDFNYTENSLEVTFINNSLYADSYLWDFGDGTTSTEINPIHVYQDYGSFDVSLTASNSDCGDNIYNEQIQLLSSSTENIDLKEKISIYPNPSKGIFTLEITKFDKSELKIEVVSLTGKVIFEQNYKTKYIKELIDLSSSSTGIYTIKLISNNYLKTLKLILSK